MNKKTTIQHLQAMLSHHYSEIKRLQNATTEQYRNENILLLSNEYKAFKSQLHAITGA